MLVFISCRGHRHCLPSESSAQGTKGTLELLRYAHNDGTSGTGLLTAVVAELLLSLTLRAQRGCLPWRPVFLGEQNLGVTAPIAEIPGALSAVYARPHERIPECRWPGLHATLRHLDARAST